MIFNVICFKRRELKVSFNIVFDKDKDSQRSKSSENVIDSNKL